MQNHVFVNRSSGNTIDEEEGRGGPRPTYDFKRLHLGVVAWQTTAMIKI